MNRQGLHYFNWSDIQAEICKEMNIKPEFFRKYHKLIGGNYKDLWHEWLHYFDEEVRNGRITRVEMDEKLEVKLEQIENDNKIHLEDFIEAVYKVWDKFNITHVKYYW